MHISWSNILNYLIIFKPSITGSIVTEVGLLLASTRSVDLYYLSSSISSFYLRIEDTLTKEIFIFYINKASVAIHRDFSVSTCKPLFLNYSHRNPAIHDSDSPAAITMPGNKRFKFLIKN